MKSSRGFTFIEVITALAVISILLPVVGIVFYNLFVTPPDQGARLKLNNEIELLSSYLYNDGHLTNNFSVGTSPYYGNFTWTDYTTGVNYLISYYATCPNASNTSCNNHIARQVTLTNGSTLPTPTPTSTPASTPTPTPTPTPTSIPTTQTYTYCDGYGVNKWAWAKAWNNSEWFTQGRPTKPDDFFDTSACTLVDADVSSYSLLCNSDDAPWYNPDTTLPLDYGMNSQLFTIHVNQNKSDVTNLSVTWRGYGGNLTSNTKLKIWNYTGSSWTTLVSVSGPGSMNITTYVNNISSPSDYINASTGYVSLLASSDTDYVDSSDRDLTVYTDYIALIVNTPIPVVPPAPTPVTTQQVFNSTPPGGTWTIPDGVTSIDKVLVVAGGGGGGGASVVNYCGGGGGAGGLIYNGSYDAVTPGQVITVTVGGGGAGGIGGNAGTNGSNSQFGSITATAGGGGGNTSGKAGGSGGGGGVMTSNYSGGTGTAGPPRQGYNGSSSYNSTAANWGLTDYAYRKTITINHSADQSLAKFCGSGASVSQNPYDDAAWSDPTNIYADDGVDDGEGSVDGYANIAGYWTWFIFWTWHQSGFNTNEYSTVLKATNFGYAIPTGSVINGIKVEIDKHKYNGNVVDAVVQLTKDGTNRVGDNKADTTTYWPNADAVSTYGNSTYLWGTTWTAAEINSANFGAHIVAQAKANDANAYIDYVKITVYWSPPAQTNYQMKLNVDKGVGTDSASTKYLNDESLSWPNDIRFTKSDGVTLLDYWIESNTSTTAKVWVEFDSIPAHPTDGSFYMYWGKASDTDASSGNNTFIFFDTFTGSAVNTSKWTITDATGWSVANSELKGTSTTGRLTSTTALTYPVAIETKFRVITRPTNGFQNNGVYVSASDAIGNLVHPTTDYYRYINAWTAWPGIVATSTDVICYLRAISSSSVDIGTYNYATGASIQAVTGLNYNITSKNIVLGKRYDNNNTGQAYEAYWDWILARNFAANEPTWGAWGGVELCNSNNAAGGGGGAGAVGANAASKVGGNGGVGVDNTSTFGSGVGASGWFAGGGGGAGFTTGGSATAGGGAGGQNSGGVGKNGSAGTANTGGGGGGAYSAGSSQTGGAGGSGVVIVKYITGYKILSTSASDGGTVTPAPPGASYNASTVVNIIATPAQCYNFVNWTGTGVDAGKVTDPSDPTTTITMSSDYDVRANFAPSTDTYSLSPLTASPAEGGLPAIYGSSPFACGFNVSISANPATGYSFTEWTPTDGIADHHAADTTVQMTTDRDLTAHYTALNATTPAPTPTNYLTTMYLTSYITANNFSLAISRSQNLINASMTAGVKTSMGKYVQKQLTIYITLRPSYLLPVENIWGDDTVSTLSGFLISGEYSTISGNVKVNGTVTVGTGAGTVGNAIDGILTCPTIVGDNQTKLSYTSRITQSPKNTMPDAGTMQKYFGTNLSLGVQVLDDVIHEYVFTGDVNLHSVNQVWQGNNPETNHTLKPGMYYSPGTITLADTYTKGSVTFIANRIIINNNNTGGLITPKITLGPFYEDLLFWANGSVGSPTTALDGAILIQGTSTQHACVSLEGVLFAPNGEIELAGSGREGWFGFVDAAELYRGALVAKNLTISGSHWNFYRW